MARLGKNHRAEKDFRDHLLSMREPVGYCCEGCGRVDAEDKTLCGVYIFPEKMWRINPCGLATHLRQVETKKGRVRVGQQKQRKK